ncbi:TetR/AcrR family transcriptional regulator [Cnuibacter sp. UC19_7]|uniref:TetR/AcrR family transcriptional regulator n=1 Tax=Cnuibacter sp. UC19_7 TaxID=3350166 RepID=UPI0036714036
MPRTSERSGPQTRARISRVATALILERGFDEVTVAEVARQAGVSSVTVFKHFPRKEDLLLDRAPEAAEMLRAAVRGATDAEAGRTGTSLERALDAVEALTGRLAEERHALSGLASGAGVFFRVVAESSSLADRSREIAAELEAVLATEMERIGVDRDDALLAAALVIAGYASVLVGTARRVIDGWAEPELAADHRRRLGRLFAALRRGLARE